MDEISIMQERMIRKGHPQRKLYMLYSIDDTNCLIWCKECDDWYEWERGRTWNHTENRTERSCTLRRKESTDGKERRSPLV